jgi:hypothetical protein
MTYISFLYFIAAEYGLYPTFQSSELRITVIDNLVYLAHATETTAVNILTTTEQSVGHM